MAINPIMRAVLNILSYRKTNEKTNYQIDRIVNTVLHPSIKPWYRMWDHHITVGGYTLPVRIFTSNQPRTKEVILFFHGGGWVSGSIDSYTKTCIDLANKTGRLVMSVDYRLAPEYPFPCAAEDCYRIARELFLHSMPLEFTEDRIILMGDSAGGNLAAVVSLMAADRGEFSVKKQILIYPSTYNDHSDTSPFASVVQNGKNYLLTSNRICNYQNLYIQDTKDLTNPYFAPLLSDHLENQPSTLIITAEYDPLRDEGEEYGEKLRRFCNHVTIHRMKNALHGFFSLPLLFSQVQQSYLWINEFLDGV